MFSSKRGKSPKNSKGISFSIEIPVNDLDKSETRKQGTPYPRYSMSGDLEEGTTPSGDITQSGLLNKESNGNQRYLKQATVEVASQLSHDLKMQSNRSFLSYDAQIKLSEGNVEIKNTADYPQQKGTYY